MGQFSGPPIFLTRFPLATFEQNPDCRRLQVLLAKHLAKPLLGRGDEIVGLDGVNDYYDVNLKKARLSQLFEASLSASSK